MYMCAPKTPQVEIAASSARFISCLLLPVLCCRASAEQHRDWSLARPVKQRPGRTRVGNGAALVRNVLSRRVLNGLFPLRPWRALGISSHFLA